MEEYTEEQLEQAERMATTIRLALEDAGIQLERVELLGPGRFVCQPAGGGVYRVTVEPIPGA